MAKLKLKTKIKQSNSLIGQKNRSKLRALQLLLLGWTTSNQYAQHKDFSWTGITYLN